MIRFTTSLLAKRILAILLTTAMVFSLIPDMRAFASDLQSSFHSSLGTSSESASGKLGEETAPGAKSTNENNEVVDNRPQLVASVFKDGNLKEPYKKDEFKGSVKVRGNFPSNVQAHAWTVGDINGEALTRISAYGIGFMDGDATWTPSEEFEIELTDDAIKTALQENKELVVLRLNEGENTAAECTIKKNVEEQNKKESLRFVTKEPGVFLVGFYGELDAVDQGTTEAKTESKTISKASAQKSTEEKTVATSEPKAIVPIVEQAETNDGQQVVVLSSELGETENSEEEAIAGNAPLAQKLMTSNSALLAAPLLTAQADGFVPINSNAEINNVIGNTTFPVYYAFDNGQVVSGDVIGMATKLTSRRIDSPANVVNAGADKTEFQKRWNAALGISGSVVTVNRAWAKDNTLQIQLAFTHANGHVYYSSQYGTTNSDNNTNNVRKEINDNQYMLQDDDKIVVRLTLANNAQSKYAANGITYGSIQNSTVKATATAFNADTYGSDYLPETVSIAGVPYTVVDGITSYTKDGVTYTLNRANNTITSPSGPAFENLDASNNGIYVNGVRFTYGLSGQVTYKGITYTIDNTGGDGHPEARTSGYRAATIGDGTQRSEATTVVNYGETHEATVIRSVKASIPLEKKLSSNETVANSLAALKGGAFVFSISQDPSNPKDGASVALRNDSSSSLTNVTISVNDVLKNATNATSGSNAQYTLKDDQAPWEVTFTKAGVYKFIVHEEDTNAEGVTYDTSDKTVVFNILEEAGSLRLVQNYRTAGTEIQATQVDEAKIGALDLEHLFNTSYALGTATRKPPTITRNGSTIVMELNEDTSGVITTAFTFDFSRSFEVIGRMRTPDSDAVAIALHGEEYLNAYRRDCNNGIDNFHYGNGDKEVFYSLMRYGYVPPNTDLLQGFLFNAMTRDYQNSWGWHAYKVENNVRMPYAASSGLNGDVAGLYKNIVPNAKSYETFNNTYENPYKNAWSDFNLKFICRDSSTGAGTLSITLMGKTIEFNDFVASDIIGADKWQNTHFSIGSSVQDGDKGGLEFDSERYLNESVKSVSTSFWADRNNDGNYETQVNTTNSFAVPGESILVRHTIEREDETSDYFYERALVRQLADVTSGTNIIPDLSETSVVTYPVGKLNEAVAVANASASSFNSNDLSKSMILKVFANTTTNFEYKITAPAEAGHVVAETALFGQPPFNNVQTDSYGFKTEKIEEQVPSFANVAELHPVCKIVDGSKTNIFFALKDAVEFADASANGLTGKNVTIQMLVPSHTIKEPITAAHGSKKITITTASRSDKTYPYMGNEGTQAKLVRGYDGDSLITSTNDLEINNITMDGNGDSYTGNLAGGLLHTKKGSIDSALILSGNTLLSNSVLDKSMSDEISDGGAVYVHDGCSLVMTDQAKIEKCSTKTNGGAIATGTKCTIELSGHATIQACEAHVLGGAVFTNNNTTLNVGENALLGDDDVSDDVDKGNKAWGSSGNTGRGGAIHAAKSYVTIGGNARILGNYAQNGGGGISVTGDASHSLTVSDNAEIAHNTSDADSGGIRVALKGTVNLEGGSLSDNVAKKNGGGIYVSESQAVNVAKGFVFARNTSSNGDGGAICASSCTINMEPGVVVGGSEANANSAKNGGGIAFEGGATLHSLGEIEVSHNTATSNGGGIYLKSDKVTNSLQLASGDVVRSNTAKNGGGIYIVGSVNQATLNGASSEAASVTANAATVSGGGVYVESGTLSLYGNSEVKENSADANGGGVYLGTSGQLNVAQAATVTDNLASQKTSNVYLPGESSSSKAGGVIMVGGELTGVIGVYAEHADHDGLSAATNEQFARTDKNNTAYTTDFNEVFQNDRNGEAKVVKSETDGNDLEWEADDVNLTITEDTNGDYADFTKEFALTITSGQLKDSTVETEMDGKAGTLSFDGAGKATVKLAHGKGIVLKGLSKTTALSVTCESVNSYRTTYDITIGDAVETGKTSCSFALSNEATVVVHNTFGAVPATGLNDSAGAWLMAVLIAGASFACHWLYRRRRVA